MDMQKYENIKNKYCVNVTNVNLNAMSNEQNSQIISGPSLTYNMNNGVVSFIDELGNSYVTPFCEIINTLKQAGYKNEGLFVPFTDNKWLNNGVEAFKWKNLLSQNMRNRNENINLNDEFNIEEELSNNMSL